MKNAEVTSCSHSAERAGEDVERDREREAGDGDAAQHNQQQPQNVEGAILR
jgi:hypothetical protein